VLILSNVLEALGKLKGKIKNVVIFISDSLRWDYTPVEVKKLGITFKTIAASIFTASSVPSIITGLYPYNHRVYSFLDKMPRNIFSILDFPGYDISIWCENTWTDWRPKGYSQIHEILQFKVAKSLEELRPPFIYIEDEKGGHCPYGWTENDVYRESDCLSFFKDYGRKSIAELRERYKRGIKRSVEIFRKRIKILEEKDVINNTLIIFTSDHGELLGEYGGLVGHGNITTPELVYVPTILIHPDIPKEDYSNEGVIRHVDIFPTILDLLGYDVSMLRVEGVSLLKAKTLPSYGKSYFKIKRSKHVFIEKGVWDINGGYVFREGSWAIWLSRLILFVMGPLANPSRIESIYLKERLKKYPYEALREYPKLVKIVSARVLKFGNPIINLNTARKIASEFKIDITNVYALKVKTAMLRKHLKEYKSVDLT